VIIKPDDELAKVLELSRNEEEQRKRLEQEEEEELMRAIELSKLES